MAMVHSCNILQIQICKMFICIEIPKHWRLSLFRYDMFKFFWLLVFRHEERETQFLLCWLFLHRPSVNSPAKLAGPESNLNSLNQQTHSTSRNPQLDCPRPGSMSTNCFFQKSSKFPTHRFRAWRYSHPSPVSYLGFLLWHLLLSHPPCTSVNTCTNSRTVQSLTKPNDKI